MKVGTKPYVIRRNNAIIDAARKVPCKDCRKKWPVCVMQFDHAHGKKLFGVCRGTFVGIAKLKAEIKKCDVICANCHCIRTEKRRHRAHRH